MPLTDIQGDVVITGHEGFIGSHLAERLPGARVCDRSIHRLDDPDTLEAVLKDSRVIVHLAGLSAGSGYLPPNGDLVRDNVFAFRGLLMGIERFADPAAVIVLMSTVHVYRPSTCYKEDTELAPSSYYGLTKLTQEVLLGVATDVKPRKVVIFRSANVYGPRCLPNYNSAVATFCHRLHADEEIELMGGGKARISLVYVSDVIEILLRSPELALNKVSIYNLSSGPSVEVCEIVDRLAECSRRVPRVRVLDTPAQRSEVENGRLMSALGGFQFTPLSDGLAETYRWHSQRVTR